jgi:hypothetical protein
MFSQAIQVSDFAVDLVEGVIGQAKSKVPKIDLGNRSQI